MAERGGQAGNKNATKTKIWSDALRRHITANPEALRRAATALVEKACDGDVPALKELGDRLEGKCIQPVAVSGDDDAPPVQHTVAHVFEQAAAELLKKIRES